MPVLKSQRSRERLRHTRPNKLMMRWLYLSCVLLSLLLVMSLTGCAASLQTLRECPKPTPIANVIDVSDWQQKAKSYSIELSRQLNSVQNTTNKGIK